ncbi:hypothetical protein BXT86_05265 [candidate division WOR-3 bacterium 4484_100]|uniref:Permease n=1 Tax=candidate division WOR-3 bacterium 4484_100 TaxID=1936077 RepID=A0A1V4QE98_UNCW3|nr:MAG: hypothetical protein BXT86_05265 [candidate division WOR-3 bacterium 4484_100]
MDKSRFIESIRKASYTLYRMSPMILGIVLLVGLISTLIPKSFYFYLFRKNPVQDAFIGAVIGSISAGNPITSYILGGEFLKQGIGISAVTAFLVAWVSVGIIQIPMEGMVLGWKFSLLRNILSFFSAIIIGIIMGIILGL